MRRGNPERIFQAQRAGVFMRLTQGERGNEHHARHAEAECIAHGRAFWDAAWGWIAEQRATDRH